MIGITEIVTLIPTLGIRMQSRQQSGKDVVYDFFNSVRSAKSDVTNAIYGSGKEEYFTDNPYIFKSLAAWENLGSDKYSPMQKGFLGGNMLGEAFDIALIVKSVTKIGSIAKNAIKGESAAAAKVAELADDAGKGVSNLKNSKIDGLTDDVVEWLGDGAKRIDTPSGNFQVVSADGNRIIRFDFQNTANPHINIQQFVRNSAGQVVPVGEGSSNAHIFLDDLK